MPVAITPPSPVSPLRRSARLVQDISPTPVKPNPKLNTNLVHSASRKRPRAPGHSIIMANPELSTPRNDKLTHSPSRKRREPPTDSIIMANLELPTPRMLRAEKRRRLSTPPTPPTPVRTPIPTRKRKAFSPSPLAEYTCDGDLPSPVSMNKKRKENSGVACTVTPTKSTRTSVIKGEALTLERRHTRRSSLLAGIDVPPVTIPPPTKRKRERRTTARASSSRLPSPPSPSLPHESDPFSVPSSTVPASSALIRTSPRRASTQPAGTGHASLFAVHLDASSPTTLQGDKQTDMSAPINVEERVSSSTSASPSTAALTLSSLTSSPAPATPSPSSSRPLRTTPRRVPAQSTVSSSSSLVMHVSAVRTSSDEDSNQVSVAVPSSLTSETALASSPIPTVPVGASTSFLAKGQELDVSIPSSPVLAEASSSPSLPPPNPPLRTSPRHTSLAAAENPRLSASFVAHRNTSAAKEHAKDVEEPSPSVAAEASSSSQSPPLLTSPHRVLVQSAGSVDSVSPTSEAAPASPPESSTVLADAPSPPQPLGTSSRWASPAGAVKPRPAASFTMHVDTSPVATLGSQEQDDTWPELPASTPTSTSPPTSPTISSAPIRAPTPLRTKVVVRIPSVVVTPPTPPPLAPGVSTDAPIPPSSDEPVPRPHNPPPQLKIQIPDGGGQMQDEQMPVASDSVMSAIIMPPLPPLPVMSPPPQPMQMNMNVVVNVPPPPPQVDLNGGVWKTACKTRVWELQRRYSPLTIRDLVAQEADDYFLRFGYPKVWNVSRETEGGDGDEEGEDWSEYESELSSDDEEEWGAKRRDDRDGDVDMDGEEDAEGEIDPDAWHDPSFSVQGETVGVEGGGGMMTAFYVPPSPVYDGGVEEAEEEEVQNVDMDMSPDVQELPQSQQPLSPVQPQSPEWSPSSPSTSPFQRISRQRQYAMYENTLPVPPPRLATIPVHALRHMEIGPRVLVGRGTPVDRARAAQWASGVCRVDEGRRGRTLSRERRGGGAGEDRDRERSGSLTPPPTFEQDPNTWDAFFESLKRGEGEASTSASVSGPAGSGGGSGSGGGMMMDLDVSLGGHTMQDSFGGSSINVNLPSALDLAPLSPLGSLSPPLSSSPPPSPSSSQCLTVGSDFLGMGIGMGMGVNMNMNLGMGMMGMGGMMGDPLNGGSGMGGVMSGGGGGDLGMGMGMGMFGMGFGVGMGIGMAVGMGAGAGWLPPVPVGVNGVECPPPQLQGGAGVGVVGVGGEGFEQGTSTLSFALG
ncbi:hypothetical protein Hypma_006153 [Hypsizygus marmoreus]|uniref:Uncharacterized protein n=1 Tax=Hypsizygus marmoreus TaxID=39966 RepID=A0A369JXL1_HYPMA|nr:hypothetical protein Hypma_006153 [Hypsizygus marmoreus]